MTREERYKLFNEVVGRFPWTGEAAVYRAVGTGETYLRTSFAGIKFDWCGEDFDVLADKIVELINLLNSAECAVYNAIGSAKNELDANPAAAHLFLSYKLAWVKDELVAKVRHAQDALLEIAGVLVEFVSPGHPLKESIECE
jgi:hypothetical protein